MAVSEYESPSCWSRRRTSSTPMCPIKRIRRNKPNKGVSEADSIQLPSSGPDTSQILLDKMADQFRRSVYRRTPRGSIAAESVQSVSILLENKEQVLDDHPPCQDDTAKHAKKVAKFLTACKEGRLQEAQGVVEGMGGVGQLFEEEDKDGWSGLHLAAKRAKDDVVSFLLKEGWPANQEDAVGDTPLQLAACCGHLTTCAVLIREGAKVGSRDADGDEPIHCASSGGHLPVVDLLLQQGARLEVRGMKDWTPLHKAAFNGHLELVQYLISRGANPDARDQFGQSPLDIAEEEGNTEVARILTKEVRKRRHYKWWEFWRRWQ